MKLNESPLLVILIKNPLCDSMIYFFLNLVSSAFNYMSFCPWFNESSSNENHISHVTVRVCLFHHAVLDIDRRCFSSSVALGESLDSDYGIQLDDL